MATYLPNVKDYIPKTETFTPNYKFLSDVLDVRQDRYNNNYKQMNNLYGDVVHADLTRANNKSTRDQYTEHLVPKMKQIAGLDLSLQENVDSAKALFKPFYENEFLVRDLVYTKAYKKQSARGQSLYNSNDPEERRKYWDGANKFLQFKLQDFADATDEESMNKPLPRWVDKMDLVTDGIAALKELDMNIEDVRFTPNGQWQITQKNGSLLRAQPTGVLDAEGKMTYSDPAGDYIKAIVLQDPKMMDYYRTKAYVEGRSFSEENQEAYGDKNAALDFWVNDQITKYTKEGQLTIDDLDRKEKKQIVSKQHWEQYKKRNGIINASQEEVEWLSTLGELQSIKQAKAAVQTTYNEVTKDGMGPNDQLTKAYIARMSFLIAKDVDLAANSYASIDAKTEWSETKSFLEKVKQSNRKAMERIKQDNREKNIKLKNSLENPPLMLQGVPHNWQGDANANNSIFALDEDNDDINTLLSINENNALIDGKKVNEVEISKYSEIVKFYNQMNAGTGSPVSTEELFAQILPLKEQQKSMVVTQEMRNEYDRAMKESGVDAVSSAGGVNLLQGRGVKNWDQLRAQFDEGNSDNVNLLYDNMIKEINEYDGKNGWLVDYQEMVNGISHLEEKLNGKELMIAGSIERTRNANKSAYVLAINTDSGGHKFQDLLDEYGVNIFTDEYDYKNQESFVADFMKNLAFDNVTVRGKGFNVIGAGPFLSDQNQNAILENKRPNNPFVKVNLIDPPKAGLFSKQSLQGGLNIQAGNIPIAGVTYEFDERKAKETAIEQYQLMTQTINSIQEKGTGSDESFQVHNAAAWYEGSDQLGSGSTITNSSGGAMDIANSAADNPGEYQWDQFLKNYLEDNGNMIIKVGDQSIDASNLDSHPKGELILKQLYMSSLANPDSDDAKENRLQLVAQYNENIGGKTLAFLDGTPDQNYSGLVITLGEKFTKAYMDPIMNPTGTSETEGLIDNTITVLWPKGEFYNQQDSDNQPRHMYEDYLQAGVPVVVERKGGGKIIFRNVYEEGNVINSVQAERYVIRWDKDLHQYVDEPVDVKQIYKKDFETWENLEMNTVKFLLEEQTINTNLQAADKEFNAKK